MFWMAEVTPWIGTKVELSCGSRSRSKVERARMRLMQP